jgi:hypothetical protein
VFLQLEPEAALASLGLVLEDPEPDPEAELLDVSVLIVAHAADHSVGTDGVDDVGLFLGSLSARCGLQEEVIVISFLFLHHLVLLDVSGVLLDGVVHRVVFAVDGADGEAWNGLRPGQTGPF